nr:mannose-1-phosphate guanylyltransferase/mannose-6-phosphate isomerase [Providencia stuartii]ELR5084299.1 mannose-1-phosphate guanylyltransferase/mannose-6-phosphate isomerase [Providencia stuartii]
MSYSKILPVIIAGGTGSRLWPLSRELYPKQFLKMHGELTMLQSTIKRVSNLDCEPPIIICNEKHRFIVAEQLQAINKLANNIILEPIGRNTAPAITLAALLAKKNGYSDDTLLLVLAADHIIKNEDKFLDAIKIAELYAKTGKLITFGIVPDKPDTGYGYIKRGEEITQDLKNYAYNVESFVEKPDYTTALSYVSSGQYYWNSGMFLFSIDSYLKELRKYQLDIYENCKNAINDITIDFDFTRINKSYFLACPDKSIDYAIMEYTQDAVVVPLNAGWSDVGSWSSLWSISPKDKEGNVCSGDIITHTTTDCMIYSQSSLITTIGLNNLIIIQTKDALLIADKSTDQNVKVIVDKLKQGNRKEYEVHNDIYRPWGKKSSIDSGYQFQVKNIIINPGKKLTMQKHQHRSEHWIILSGTAKVTVNDQVTLLKQTESIYIPVDAKHSLENPGELPLHLIEVRSGSYIEEDDIIRYSE